MNYKKVIGAGVGSIMLLSVISPSFALAESIKSGKNFCNSLTIVEKEISRVENLGKKVTQKSEERATKIKENWINFDAKKEEKASKNEAERALKFARKESKAKNTERLAQIASFKAQMDSLVQVKKETVEKAVTEYRANMEKFLTEKKATLETISNDYKTALSEALVKAKADCEAGIDPKIVKENFASTKKSAQEKMKLEKSSVEKTSEEVKTLVEKRKLEVEKAREIYKAGVEKAKLELKKQKETTNTVNPTNATTTTTQ